MRGEARVEALRSRMSQEEAGLFVALSPANVTYLTAFDGVFDEEPASLAVVSADRCWVITDSRYLQAVKNAAEGTAWGVILTSGDVFGTLAEEIASKTDGKVSVESSIPYKRFVRLRRELGRDVEASDGWVEAIRTVKDADEISRIEAAQALTDETFGHLLGVIRPGMTERELALELEFHMRRAGSEGVAFAPIVASGPNSALPHARVTDRALREGDFLKLDFGARVDGYCADMTRTLVIGTADTRHKEIYSAVLEANSAGLGALAAGTSGAEVDAAARAVIEGLGYGELFGHGLGHGVGLEVHEGPSLSRRGTEPLPEGCVVTVEPGIYVPDFGGVRIEDLAVVQAGGNRVLTRSPKELIEL